ncbi:sulfurtransferase TusA family protein [Vagococcus vulneris]|uniref:UPF0033 domain-containing protein n=1 Tax=Vagococcus vulneris TaxID=1977869 RepID=A0A430A1R1_9ENTE|nr:sulfurtransferase TusA family protein [Vagococcus vulneris]RSU00279.1 hypothetical protein CBF37_02995 [Vagococcus vulneris]
MERKIINTKGQDCPIPLMELKKAVKESKPGQEIELIFTCPEAVENIPNYALEQDFEVLDFNKIGTEGWTITIKC